MNRFTRIVYLPRDWPYPLAVALSVHRVWHWARGWEPERSCRLYKGNFIGW